MAAEKPRDPTKKFTFSVRTRTLFWRRADEKSETPAPPRRVTLGQLPYLPHTAATLSGLSRLDRACLAFCRFVVARRVVACCAIAGLYAVLAGAGICVEIKSYGAFVLSRRVVLHAIDATPARWRGDAGSSSPDGASTAASSPRNDFVKNCQVHLTHWLISTQRITLLPPRVP